MKVTGRPLARSWPWPSRSAPRRNGSRTSTIGTDRVTRQPPSPTPPVSCRPNSTVTLGSGNSIGVVVVVPPLPKPPDPGSSVIGVGQVPVAL